MNLLTFTIFLSAIAALAYAGQLESLLRKRQRRNYYQTPEEINDAQTALAYWRLPIKLSMFVNNEAVDAEPEARSMAFKRTMPSSKKPSEGSGSGSGTPVVEGKRSNVPTPEVEHKEIVHQDKPEQFQAEKKSELTANSSRVEEMSDDDGTKRTTTITCQGQKDWLQCPMYRLIKINSAFWGRDDTKTCHSGIEHGLKTNEICAQDESNTMAKVQNACEGESACELVASPVYFDRTDCPDIYKFMRVNWECAHSESRIKETLEEEKEEIMRHKAEN